MGVTSTYRDASVPIEQRIDDLLGRMTLEEKAGLMFHPPIFIGDAAPSSRSSNSI
jgi:beta-glucosidase